MAVIAATLIIGLDVQQAIDHPEMNIDDSGGPLALVDSRDLLQRALAEDPPRTPVDLRELVIDLQDATPITNQTDFDNDLLYDSVEKVIGTDPTRNDTDSDRISDFFEVMNGTDPLLSDSNFDGIFDFDEVNVSLDLDEDGVPNAWDFDNDGDGVNDDPDLSPFACSDVMDEFDIQVQTDGMPTFITIQLTPENVEHLKLVYQTWDWPFDEEGIMQDLDDSANDITISPYLRIRANQIPSESALNEMHVISTEGGLLIKLSPVLEYDTIVAFTGRLLYDGSVPTEINLTAELIWSVDGVSDIAAETLKANDEYLTLGQDMIAVCNVTEEANALPVEWIHIRENSERIRFALKILDGPYLTVAPDGHALVFNSSSLGSREEFLYWKQSNLITAFNGDRFYVNPKGQIVLQYTPNTTFEVIERVFSSATHLVSYTEPFIISGVTVEEFYGCEVGVFYNSTNRTHTIAACWDMTYRFVNNATTTLADMPALLLEQNVNASHFFSTTRDRYEALVVLGNDLFPAAMAGAPSDIHYPIIAAFEDRSKILDLSQVLVGSHIVGDSCLFDLPSTELVTSKSLKLNWYNTSTYIALAPVELCVEVALMNLSDMASANLLAILLRWDTGIHTITAIGAEHVNFEAPDSEELSVTQLILMGTLESLNLGAKLVFMFNAWKELNIYVKNMKSVTEVTERLEAIRKHFSKALSWVDTVQNVFTDSKFLTWLKYSRWINANRNTRFTKFCKGFEKSLFVVGVLVDIGLAIWAGFALADQIGGQVGREMGTIYGVTAVIIGVFIIALLAIIEMIPVVGWLLAITACIVDAVGGYSTKLIQWLTDWIFGTPMQCGYTTPNAFLDERPDISIIDSEMNGLTVGDALRINGSLWQEINAYIFQAFVIRYDKKYDKTDLARMLTRVSLVNAYVTFHGPEGIDQQVEYMRFNTSEPVERQISEWPFQYRTSWEREFGALVYPAIAMPNYPITLRLNYPYVIRNSWKHYVFSWFGLGGDCYHDDVEANMTTCYDVVTFKYDVFPAALDEFLVWKYLTANDPDGDQLLEDRETANGLSPWNYDSDGDGLNDKYELESGLDGTRPDTDMDGVSDWYEHVYGTNATNSDTDEDGVDDFKEISGWIISFDYLGNNSLKFQIPVTSDPRDNDTDGDGVDDYREYWFATNPRSNDTNADEIPDSTETQKIVSEAIYDAAAEWTYPAHPISFETDICVDKDGFLYASGYVGGYYANCSIRKYDTSMQQVQFPEDSFFDSFEMYQDSGWPNDTAILSIAVDDQNEWLYASYWITESNELWRFDMNGTVINPDSWTTTYGSTETEIDSLGNIYGLTYRSMRKTASDGTPVYLVNAWGSAQNQLTNATDFGFDEDRGIFYVVETGGATWGPRVVRRQMSDFSYIDEFVSSSELDDASSIAVDDDGFVYLLANDTGGMNVRKYDPTGVEDESFRFYGNGTHSFSDFNPTSKITIGPDKSIYISEVVTDGNPTTVRLWKFSQIIHPVSEIAGTLTDWDNDTLTNVQEINGWDITVNFPSGEETFRVTSSHLLKDTDFDGLDDYLEYTLGSNPRSPDTDQDGASDHYEWWLSQYPGAPYQPPLVQPAMAPRGAYQAATGPPGAGPSLTDWDTDGDLLMDSTELTFGSSPVNPDSDDEGLSDLNEFIFNSNPNSADSDGDGASDALEFAMNSSLLNADSDGDLIFDGAEYIGGTNPRSSDQDGDGILDGIELYFGSNPLSNDSDDDGLLDYVEVSLWLDINNNDTDGDGVLDGIEVARGTDPWLTDSDWDGVPDNEDPDTLNPWGGQIALVYDEDASDGTVAFGGLLGNYSYVTVYDAQTFLDVEQDFRYVVLVGRPAATAGGTAGLVYNLLEGTGSMLTTMMDPDIDNIAVRYGVWTDPQTVVLMSGANVTDVFTVLQILKYFEVSLFPDSVLVQFNAFEYGHNVTVDYAFPVNSIDTVKATDTALLVQLSGPAVPSIQITRYNQTTTPHPLTPSSGLADGEAALGRYIDVSIEISGTTEDVFESALILLYYRALELDLTGNGMLGDIGDVNETTLSLYSYDEIREEWVKITDDLSWVIATGVNTTDINVFGENYAGYVWIQTTELSLFAIAGQTIHETFGLLETVIVIVIVSAVAIVTVVFLYRWRKRRTETHQMALLTSLKAYPRTI